jgi:hypothetical protein
MGIPIQPGARRATVAGVRAASAGRRHRGVVTVLALLAASMAQSSDLAPDAFFLQVGSGEGAVEQRAAGLRWDWGWPERRIGSDRLRGSWEVSIGRWRGQHSGSAAWYTQVGITPALRYEFAPEARRSWFVEAGIGANLIAPVFQSGEKRFSTVFNFGDHLAIGWRTDRGPVSEVALRFQHFSNAGIDAPNPGENFLQLRLAKSFGRRAGGGPDGAD